MNRWGFLKSGIVSAILFSTIVSLSGCYVNQPPVADAGEQTGGLVGQVIELSGARSYDPDGSIQYYNWVMSFAPDGSNAILNTPDSVTTTFMPDLPGVYVIELTVYDQEKEFSSDHVIVNIKSDLAGAQPPLTGPTPLTPDLLPLPIPFPPSIPPIAYPPIIPPFPPANNFSATFTGLISEEIVLQGEMSDVNGTRSIWDVVGQPEGAKIILSSTENNEINFKADMQGIYTLLKTIYINGQMLLKQHYTILIADNMVDLGRDLTVITGKAIELQANLLQDIDVDKIETNWDVLSAPENRAFSLLEDSKFSLKFIPVMEGKYELMFTATAKDGSFEYKDSIIVTAVDINTDNVDHANFEGACVACHNGITAMGKSVSHATTTDVCEACHSIISWIPAMVDHREVIGACIDCHNGTMAVGKPNFHLPTSNMCDSCHSTTAWRPTIVVDHSQLLGTCNDCHNGVMVAGKSANHIPSTDNCAACHSATAFVPVITVDHVEVIGSCVSCHNGIVAIGKPVLHPDSTDQCDSCHSTVMWRPVANDPVVLPDVPSLTLDMSSPTYQAGELIKAKAIYTNNTNSDIIVMRSTPNASPVKIEVTGNGIDRLILSNPNDPQVDITVIAYQVLNPGQSIVREVMWDQTLPRGGLAPAGEYRISASVQGVDLNGKIVLEERIVTSFLIEHVNHTVKEEDALLLAIKEPAVQTWYEANGSDIMCRVNQMVVKVTDFTITPIATLLPIPESDIKCHTELIKSPGLQWHAYFHSNSEIDKFSYRVVVDAMTGEIIASEII